MDKKFSLLPALSLAAGLALNGAWADDTHGHRHHGAHEHGVGRLDLALEGELLYIELESPAVNIVGFEHAPANPGEQQALDRAVATLESADRLFLLPPDAECRLDGAEVDAPLQDPHQAHGEITAEYRFACPHPERLEQLELRPLFQAFPATGRLEVRFVTAGRQGAAELTPAQPVLKF